MCRRDVSGAGTFENIVFFFLLFFINDHPLRFSLGSGILEGRGLPALFVWRCASAMFLALNPKP